MAVDFDFEGEIGIQTEEEIDQELDSLLTAQGCEIQNKSLFGVFWRAVKLCVVWVFVAFQNLLVVVAKGSFWEVATGAWLKLRAPEFGVTETDGKTDEQIREEGKAKSGREGVWKAGVVYQVLVNEATSIPVEYIYVDDEHPRGQGSVDIYLTNEDGLPDQSVYDLAYDFIITQQNRGIGDNVRILFPPKKSIDISVQVVLFDDKGDIDATSALVEEIVKAKFRLNRKYMAASNPKRVVERVHLKKDLVYSQIYGDLDVLIEEKKEVRVLVPSQTVTVGKELPELGTLTIDVIRESDDN